MTYFGFALADGMFSEVGHDGDHPIFRRVLTIAEAREIVKNGVEACLNPSHAATIEAMTQRFGIVVAIPEKPPTIRLGIGDRVLVMGVRGLPRLTDRHEYTQVEIDGAGFEFAIYTVGNKS